MIIMTPEEAEWNIFKRANSAGKFAIPIGAVPDDPAVQKALERGFDEEWYALIDVSPIAELPGIFRVYRLTPKGQRRKAALRLKFAS